MPWPGGGWECCAVGASTAHAKSTFGAIDVGCANKLGKICFGAGRRREAGGSAGPQQTPKSKKRMLEFRSK